MEFDLSWILLGLPLAFALGWLASRLDIRQLRIESRRTPKAYFKGLNHLLNEQQDQAIDAFIEAVQHDPDTSELHFALGNLFRRRGEYERAVRVHQHLLARGDLSQAERDRAQHALALDYLKAGLLDRAEEALRKLEHTAFESQAHLALLSIYERSRDWSHAYEIAEKLNHSNQGSFNQRMAHYLCEQAEALQADTDHARMAQLLTQAMAIAPQAPRPRMALAQLQEATGHTAEAYDTLMALTEQIPSAWPLAAAPIARLAMALARAADTVTVLERAYDAHRSLDLLNAVVQLHDHLGHRGSQQWYARHLQHEPSLVAAAQWLAQEPATQPELQALVRRALQRATQPLQRYRCAACGFEASQHFWQCPGCQTWDSYPMRRVEEL